MLRKFVIQDSMSSVSEQQKYVGRALVGKTDFATARQLFLANFNQIVQP